MKTQEERNALKEEVKTLNKNLTALTGKELEQVPGGDGSISEVIGEWDIPVKLKEDKLTENP